MRVLLFAEALFFFYSHQTTRSPFFPVGQGRDLLGRACTAAKPQGAPRVLPKGRSRHRSLGEFLSVPWLNRVIVSIKMGPRQESTWINVVLSSKEEDELAILIRPLQS